MNGESKTKTIEDEHHDLDTQAIKWHPLNPGDFNPASFGVSKIYQIQCRREYGFSGRGQLVREGWLNFVKYLDHHPVTKKPLAHLQWWLFAVKHSIRKDNGMARKLSLLEQFALYITSNLSDDTKYRILKDLRKNPTIKENINNYNIDYLYDIDEIIQVLTQSVFYNLGYRLVALGLIDNHDYILEDVFEADTTDIIYDFGESLTKKGETDGVHTHII